VSTNDNLRDALVTPPLEKARKARDGHISVSQPPASTRREGLSPNPVKRERGTGRLFLRGTIWWAQYYHRGRQIRISSNTDNETKARKFLREKLATVLAGTHGEGRNLRYKDLRAAYILDYQVNKRKSLHHDKAGHVYLDAVKRLDDFFEGYRADEIDADVIRLFQSEQQARHLANGTINRSVSGLRRMFNLALEDGKLKAIPHFPMLEEAPPRSGFFEHIQFEKLRASLPSYLRIVLALGYYAGMRRAEVLSLTWKQVNFIENSIVLLPGKTKNNQGRTIPMVPQLRRLLSEQYGGRQDGCPYVCFRFDRRGQAVKIRAFRKAWQSRCIKLGFGAMEPATDPKTGEMLYDKPRKDRRNAKAKVKLVYRGMLYHDLRRTFVRSLVRSGTPEKVSMQFSGHLTRDVFDRYDITSGKDVIEAGERLAAYLEKNGDKTGTALHQDAAKNLPVC
jgi:integrase